MRDDVAVTRDMNSDACCSDLFLSSLFQVMNRALHVKMDPEDGSA